MKEWWAEWYNKYAVLALSAAVGVGGYNAICWSKLTPSDWGTWLGSIGTIGTLIGTIYLATDRDRKDKRLAERKAFVIAAKIALPLQVFLDNVRYTHGRLDFRTDEDFWTRNDVNNEARSWGAFDVSTEDLAALSVLEGNHAFRLARALQILAGLKCDNAELISTKGPGDLLSPRQLVDLCTEIGRAEDHLLTCNSYYMNILLEHAHDPTDEEIFGW